MDKSNSNGKDTQMSDLLDTLLIIVGMEAIGQIVITPTALEVLSRRDVNKALVRHLRGDWGDVEEEDWKANNWAVNNDERVLSAYHSSDGVKFWIITEADRSKTTVLLPKDY